MRLGKRGERILRIKPWLGFSIQKFQHGSRFFALDRLEKKNRPKISLLPIQGGVETSKYYMYRKKVLEKRSKAQPTCTGSQGYGWAGKWTGINQGMDGSKASQEWREKAAKMNV